MNDPKAAAAYHPGDAPVVRPDLDALIAQCKAGAQDIEYDGYALLLREAAAAIAAERARADQAAEKAWDEGYMAVPAEPEHRQFFVEDAPNPYRAAATAEQ